MSIPLDPWQAARDRYLEDLSDHERALFNGASVASLEEIFYSASAADKLDQDRSTLRAFATKIQPLTAAIEEYGKAIDVVANASSLILCPIWGSIRVVLHLASDFGKYFENIVDMLGRIGDVLPRFRQYERLFSHHLPLLQTLSIAYFDIINACMRVKSVFREAKRRSILRSKRLLWRLFNREFDEILEIFRTHRKNVEKDAGLAHMIEASESRAEEREGRELEHKRRQDELRRHLMMQLPSVDTKTQHRRLRKKRHSAGCGKSILATKIIDILESEKSSTTAVVYFYCEYSDLETLHAPTVLGTLARQLLRDTEITAAVELEIKDCFVQGMKMPELEQVARILNLALSSYSSAYFVIDGLDECPRDEQDDVLRVLASCLEHTNTLVKVVIASRDSNHLNASFPVAKTIILPGEDSLSDIAAYVKGSISSLRQTGRLLVHDESVNDEIISTLCQKAQGMFLWVAFQLLDLCEAISDSEIPHVLQNLPKDLAETYERILLKIKQSQAGSKRFLTAMKVFRWIICSQRPLSVEEVKEAVAFGPGDTFWDSSKIAKDEKRLLQSCGNLVVLDRDDGAFRLAHSTVRQFLISPSLKSDLEDLHFGLDSANHCLGETCVAYLSFSDFETQITSNPKVETLKPLSWATSSPLTFIGDSTKLGLFSWPLTLFGRHEVASPDINFYKYAKPRAKPSHELHKKYALLKYCTDHWLHHTREFSPSESDPWKAFVKLTYEKKRLFDFRDWEDRYVSRNYPYMSLFTWALDHGHRPLLESLLNPPKGPTLQEYYDFHAGSHRSPLDRAAINGHLAVVSLFASKLAVKIQDLRHLPLLAAVENNNLEVLYLLLRTFSTQICSSEYTDLFGELHLLTAKKNLLNASRRVMQYSNGRGINSVDSEGRTALYYAAENGHHGIATLLLSHGADINCCEVNPPAGNDEDAGTSVSALNIAAKNSHNDLVRLFLDWKEDVNKKDRSGNTALHYAASSGNRAMLLDLFEHRCNIDAQNAKGRTALHLAVMSHCITIIPLLNILGASVELVDNTGRTPSSYLEGSPTLRKTLDDGCGRNGGTTKVTDIKSLFLERSVVGKSPKKSTILKAAACLGEEDVAKILLSDNINIDELREDDKSAALAEAVSAERENMVHLLLRSGADFNTKLGSKGQTALHFAAGTSNDKILHALLEMTPDLSVQDFCGSTVLHIAVGASEEQNVSILLKYNAQIALQDKSGETPLHIACYTGNITVVQALLDNGANLSTLNTDGNTPLHIAAALGNTDIVGLLLRKGAIVHDENHAGHTPLDLACSAGNRDVVKSFLIRHSSLLSHHGNGDIPLHVSAGLVDVKTVRQLLRAGKFDPSTPNNAGDTALHKATWNNHLDVVRALLDHGANPIALNLEGITPGDISQSIEDSGIADDYTRHGKWQNPWVASLSFDIARARDDRDMTALTLSSVRRSVLESPTPHDPPQNVIIPNTETHQCINAQPCI